jgi:hypothetical protein
VSIYSFLPPSLSVFWSTQMCVQKILRNKFALQKCSGNFIYHLL